MTLKRRTWAKLHAAQATLAVAERQYFRTCSHRRVTTIMSLLSCFQVVSIPTNADGSQDTHLDLSLVSPYRSCYRLGRGVLLHAVSYLAIGQRRAFFVLNLRGGLFRPRSMKVGGPADFKV